MHERLLVLFGPRLSLLPKACQSQHEYVSGGEPPLPANQFRGEGRVVDLTLRVAIQPVVQRGPCAAHGGLQRGVRHVGTDDARGAAATTCLGEQLPVHAPQRALARRATPSTPRCADTAAEDVRLHTGSTHGHVRDACRLAARAPPLGICDSTQGPPIVARGHVRDACRAARSNDGDGGGDGGGGDDGGGEAGEASGRRR